MAILQVYCKDCGIETSIRGWVECGSKNVVAF